MEPVRVIREDLVLVDWGPMTLTISCWQGGRAMPVMAAQTARLALRCLALLADFQGYLKKPADSLPPDRELPSLVERMRSATSRLGRGLTPLAAVAGAVGDELAAFAAGLGADKAIINNGGDIALHLAPGQEALVGVRPPAREGEEAPPLLGRLRVRGGQGVGGVATSGWQGRSLSPGVADAVTVWANSGAMADAAATLVAGAVAAPGLPVQTRPAREMLADSDLGAKAVTTGVDVLSPEQRLAALEAGLALAREFQAQGFIQGCLANLQGDTAVLDPAGRLLPA